MSFASKGYVDSKLRAVEDELRSLVTGGAQNLGKWDASTNTPTIVQGQGEANAFYDVSVGGIWNGETFVVGDKIVSNKDKQWYRLATGEIKNSKSIRLSNRSREALDGVSSTQDEANILFTENIKNIIIFTEDVDATVREEGGQKRPYYQTKNTSLREKGFYFIDNNNKIQPFGGGVGKPDDISIEINSNIKLGIKGFEQALNNQMLVKDNGTLRWVDAVNTEILDKKVQQAATSATQSGTYASQSGGYAAEAMSYRDDIKNYVKNFPDDEAYQEAIRQGQIKEDTISFIRQESAIPA